MMSLAIPLARVRIKTFSAASAADLDDDVNDWIIANAGNKTLLTIEPQFDGGSFVLHLLYTE